MVLGIGDDAALLRLRAGDDLAVSTDALVEDVHFRFASEAPRSIGRRALAAALSDLAAMGARPLAVVAALAAPPTLPLAHAEGIVRGIVDGARRWDAPLVGGNVARAKQTSLTLTVLGAVRRGRALTRAGARPGDRIFVTGTLGGAALAVARAARGARVRIAPEPRLAAGLALARLLGVGACIDVSDGLVADLGHLLRASRVGAQIDPARVPRPAGFAAACRRAGADPERLALAGGEDYELLFTLRSRLAPAALQRRLGVRVAEIGAITRVRGLRGLPAAGQTGWTHF
ncbi:MAG: thiamine-monophosphate kinase [Deltaproteobacteria bacterium]|nr:thiamine-monophosphate kinase [Deltaproteobacteria bacterium]